MVSWHNIAASSSGRHSSFHIGMVCANLSAAGLKGLKKKSLQGSLTSHLSPLTSKIFKPKIL